MHRRHEHGAFVGSVYAAGNLEAFASTVRGFDWKSIAGLLDPVFPRSGLVDGRRLSAFLDQCTSSRTFEGLLLRFCAVATDLVGGAEVLLDSGPLTEAVRASIAVPGFLTPVLRDGAILVDGGLVNPVPVSVVRRMGADFVIAVDVNGDVLHDRLTRILDKAPSNGLQGLLQRLRAMNIPAGGQVAAWLERAPAPSVLEVLAASLYVMQAQIARASLKRDPPDLLIRPRLGSVTFMDFDRAGEIIEQGYLAARSALRDGSCP